MSSLNAALLVIGLLLLFGVPALWWVFTRMDNPPHAPAPDPLPTDPITSEEANRIEEALHVKLPSSYREFLTSPRTADIDGQSVFADADSVIAATLYHRNGSGGSTPWPTNLIYIGDEADVCPYVLDTRTGEVVRTDKGNLARVPLNRFASFEEFLSSLAE